MCVFVNKVAMYVHGLRFSSAHSRLQSNLDLSDPIHVLKTLASEERQLVYEDRLAKKRKKERALEEV
jgi:hypothetical protein